MDRRTYNLLLEIRQFFEVREATALSVAFRAEAAGFVADINAVLPEYEPLFSVGERVRTSDYDDGDPTHKVSYWTGTIVNVPAYEVLRDHPSGRHRSYYAMSEGGLSLIEDNQHS